MKLLLKKAARINHEAGEIVEVSPAQANFLLSVNAAEIIQTEQRESPEKKTTTATRRKATK
ncbi:MAG: hypothetical protein IIZ83_06510 [Oscillospiraceae bacterium]|nr:hypothetical protein [Oscillospiraceae bacterium]